MSASDYRARLEDATDCCGAAREDDELVLVTVGDLRSLLSEAAAQAVELERMRGALARIASRADGDATEDLPAPLAVAILNLARQALVKAG